MSQLHHIGILGGGQLAQMLTQVADSMGIRVSVLVKRLSDALPSLVGRAIVGDWDNPETAVTFARQVDLVTLENEFVNPISLESIEQEGIPLFPTSASIRLIQDKWHQKEALARHQLPVVTSQAVGESAEVVAFAATNGWPVVLKRRHQGYDGKGNATVRRPEELPAAWSRLAVNENGLYVEAFCPFDRELAMMVTRARDGESVLYPVVDTVQKDHICHTVTAPSQLPATLAHQAAELARQAVEVISGIGTFGVEMFLTPDQTILINELAPRVHNSGHYTIEACICSQFENHLRAILGLPLGSPAMIKPHSVMINLISAGDGPALPSGYREALAVAGAHLHLYGKSHSSKGRKMGHVTALGDTADEARIAAEKCAGLLRFG
jgi:5-(carboxyamino)imidazole ribonucleotide synthase